MAKEAPLCILIALFLYGFGLYQSRKYQAVNGLILFSFGLLFDGYGTWQMSLAASGMGLDWHGYLGWLAIGLMALLVGVGLLDLLLVTSDGPNRLRKFAPWATGVWFASFISGIIKHVFHVW